MRRLYFSLLLLLLLPLDSLLAAEAKIIVATWNVGLIDRAVSDLDLQGFAAEIDADILVLNEVKTIDQIQEIQIGLGREDDFIAISSFVNGNGNLEVGMLSRSPWKR